MPRGSRGNNARQLSANWMKTTSDMHTMRCKKTQGYQSSCGKFATSMARGVTGLLLSPVQSLQIQLKGAVICLGFYLDPRSSNHRKIFTESPWRRPKNCPRLCSTDLLNVLINIWPTWLCLSSRKVIISFSVVFPKPPCPVSISLGHSYRHPDSVETQTTFMPSAAYRHTRGPNRVDPKRIGHNPALWKPPSSWTICSQMNHHRTLRLVKSFFSIPSAKQIRKLHSSHPLLWIMDGQQSFISPQFNKCQK